MDCTVIEIEAVEEVATLTTRLTRQISVASLAFFLQFVFNDLMRTWEFWSFCLLYSITNNLFIE